ncbi:MAG: chromosome segregation protein SMC [Peptoniphilus sp.]|nr:chromosome segregation protein SMC [Peptoniphilus sp.]MDD7363872.1 chromosome segregation protein SMC [Bacillota bacterium]MDY6044289.1 chromosome segregation protein SMC [Peptoniphilus sp.]
MHLIEMELYGFKSFAKRTRIRFSEEITAIVGPNGSGKSNIVDAIMWALGESSVKQLRGSKMEDVIFSGTDRHQGVNYAEVVLTFDNKDGFFDLPYEELSISRKYFRSGESQYAINKKRVRQKDVREIFLDTGIGKNGYSFIGQGQIDEILSTRPQDRRNAFEEAAGISKYKLKKEETVRNLAKTTEHIDRIDDIYFELLNRSEEMEGRREKALKLEELQKKENIYSYALAKREIALFKEKRDAVSTKREEVQKSRDEKNEMFRKKDGEREALERELDTFDGDETSLRNKMVDVVREKEQLAALIRSKREQKTALLKRLEQSDARERSLSRDIEIARDALARLEGEIAGADEKLRAKSSDVAQLESSLEEMKATFQRENLGIKSRKEEAERLNDEKHSAESRRQALSYLIEEKEERLKRLSARREQIRKEEEEISTSLEEYAAKEEEIGRRADELTETLRDAQQLWEALKDDLKRFEEREMPLKVQIESLGREKEYLMRLKDTHEGFQYAVKQFLKSYESEGFSNTVIGPVADAFQIEKEYALAVSTALGYSGQNIILKDDSRIGEILSYLKKKKIGRMTFLPINSLRPRSVEANLSRKTRVPYRVASECVRCEGDLRVVAEHLLGRVLLVERAEDGKQLSRDLEHRYRVVTKAGDVFQTGGAVTGGQSKNHNLELYNREAGIKKKTTELNEAREQLEQLNEARRGVEEKLRACELSSKAVAEEYRRVDEDVEKIGETLKRLGAARDHLIEQRDALDAEMQKETASVKKDRAECEEISRAIDQVDASLQALSGDDDETSERLRTELEILRDRVSEERLAKQKLVADVREATLKRNQSEKDIETLEQAAEESEAERRSARKELEEIEHLLALKEPDVQTLREAETHIEDDLRTLRKSYASKRDHLKQLKANVDAIRDAVFSEEKELVRLNGEWEEAEASYDDASERLEELTVPEEEDILEETSIGALRRDRRKIVNEIDRIGPVDADTLEQYDAWNERVTFLSTQREDLFLSKDKLKKMIKELDKNMREQLDEALILINGYFNDIFKELFQGGEASLAWEEGDILEAGILISARPPGKKLQSLSLLSGGERSMTAVALLFALLKMRQSPFCIVDEIDAALDDANIRRYSNYVKNIEDMQFIMITHRKQTMEMANEIYGVTMEEKGISRILFLELEEVEDHVGMDKKEIR